MTQNCGPEGGREGERERGQARVHRMFASRAAGAREGLPANLCIRQERPEGNVFYGRWHHMYILCFEKMGHLRLREPHVDGQRESGG